MWGILANIATDADLGLFGVPCTATLDDVTTEFTGNYSARTRRKSIDASTGFEVTTFDPTVTCKVADLPNGRADTYMAITVRPQMPDGTFGDSLTYQVAAIDEADVGSVRLVLSGLLEAA